MSAPDTKLSRQKRRHRGPLIGITLAVGFGIVMILLLLFVTVSRSTAPDGAPGTADAPAEQTENPAPAAGD